jgi:hypothetical protein
MKEFFETGEVTTEDDVDMSEVEGRGGHVTDND